MRNLYQATRDDLIDLIRQQDEVIDQQARRLAAQEQELRELRQTVARLTEQVGALLAQLGDAPGGSSGKAQGMPGLKTAQLAERAAVPRKARAHGAGRKRMKPTRVERHALRRCPDCGADLSGGTVKRTREVIELAAPRIEVIEHQYVERRCPGCGKRCVPAPQLAGAVSGRGRLGHRLTSVLVLLREEARLPVRMIQQVLHTLTGLHLSTGAIVGASQRVAQQADGAVAAAIRASPVVHVDETGWRQNGRNQYAWTASTEAARLFLAGTRQKGMVDALIGVDYPGVIVSDFYAAYTGDDRLHQYCWAHLLRDIDELVEQHPADPGVRGWAAAVHAIFGRAQVAAAGSPNERRSARVAAEAELAQVCAPWREPRVPQTPLCARMMRYLERLFVFVTESAVPPTNNAAERSLRHLVTIRKISGGSRSEQGTTTRMTLASLYGTWRVQGVNAVDACQALLASPQV